jgi:hypothetical protein
MPFNTLETEERNSFVISPDKNEWILGKKGSIASIEPLELT